MSLKPHLKIDYSSLGEEIQNLKEVAFDFIEGFGEETPVTKYIKNVLKIMDAYIDILSNPDAYDDKYIERVAHLSSIHLNILMQFMNIGEVIKNAIE